ncbi:DmpA family aminopeptidase [Peribacillus deserti]|uniref:Aminopeptidase n=1 Tax=Peribacillus deserti TaxID=673318 RepID=A0A2N5M8N9_9BACI|nr:P1 family peptidase [Peribacillus deserti]PLT30731.1 aminopeptidase [Peribacillus deserti]
MKIRDRGIIIGTLKPAGNNCITDVPGVKVGHVTLDEKLEGEEYAATGVTAILPHGGNLFQQKVPAASYVLNGFGKTTGLVQVNELGLLESPIMLTNTFAVPAVTEGALKFMLEQNPEIGETTGTINIVAGECNDSYLNSIRHFSVKPDHAYEAIQKAGGGQAQEGAVGAGKGMICFGHKGGIGSSSRKVDEYTMGCMVLSNFGRKEEFQKERYRAASSVEGIPETSDGSIIIVLATDAPLSDRQLLRAAKRTGIGLSRTGSHFSNGSGDIVIAFSTAQTSSHYSGEKQETRIQLRDDHAIMNMIFTAASEAAEEAILNSLSQADTTRGRKGRVVSSYPF